MAKFIHSDKLSSFKSTFTDWNNTSSATYKAIAFIDEGYIVTHGQIFSTGLGAKKNPYGLSVSNTDGKLEVTVGGYSDAVNVLIGATDGTFTSASVKNGNVTINHKKTSDVSSYEKTTKGTDSDNETSESATIVSYIDYDEYGHLYSANARKLILNKVKSTSDANASTTKRYLLGHKSIGQTDETYANSEIYFIGNTLHVGDLKVGSSSITDLISASQALYFKGTIGKSITNADNKTTFNTLPTANVKVGDLYVVGTGGYTVTHSDNTTDVCEAGDMIIATATTPTWAVVQRNLENALTESNLNGTTSGNKLKVYKDDENLYVTQTDTNTWREVNVGGAKKLANNVDTPLNFLTGQTGISISYDNGIKIENSSPLSSAKLLTLKYYKSSNDTTATNWASYTPTTTKTLTFKAGKNITLSSSEDILTITAADAPTHYDLTISGTDSTNNTKSIIYSPIVAKKTIKFGSNLTTTVSNDVLTVSGTANTWRNVSAYLLSGDQSSAAEILSTSTIGTADLAFGSDFVWTKAVGAADGEIQIGWCEITTGSDGTITKAYAV